MSETKDIREKLAEMSTEMSAKEASKILSDFLKPQMKDLAKTEEGQKTIAAIAKSIGQIGHSESICAEFGLNSILEVKEKMHGLEDEVKSLKEKSSDNNTITFNGKTINVNDFQTALANREKQNKELISNLNSQIASLTNNISNKDAEIKKVKEDNESLQKQFKTSEEKYKREVEIAQKSLGHGNAELERQIQSLKKELADKNNLMKTAYSHMEADASQISDLKAKLNNTINIQSTVEELKNELETTKRKFEISKQQSIVDADEAERKLKALQEEFNTYKKDSEAKYNALVSKNEDEMKLAKEASNNKFETLKAEANKKMADMQKHYNDKLNSITAEANKKVADLNSKLTEATTKGQEISAKYAEAEKNWNTEREKFTAEVNEKDTNLLKLKAKMFDILSADKLNK